MLKLLVIGYGNPMREDDGIGWHLARFLEEKNEDDTVHIIQSHQLMPEYSEEVSKAKKVLFIDCKEGPEVGKIDFKKIEPAYYDAENKSTFHHMSIEGILSVAGTLYKHMPEAWVFTVESNQFGHNEWCSTEMRKFMTDIEDRILEEVKTLAV